MERVLVIGCGGAGKTTFSKRLSKITGLEVLHLDQYFWKPNWQETSKSEWTLIVDKLISKPQWIMDGNYGGTLDRRISRADTIIFLNYSTLRCLWRITKRTLKFKGKQRPDIGNGCMERFDLNFYRYVATYNQTRRKAILNKLNKLANDKQIMIFTNDKQTNDYLLKIENAHL